MYHKIQDRHSLIKKKLINISNTKPTILNLSKNQDTKNLKLRINSYMHNGTAFYKHQKKININLQFKYHNTTVLHFKYHNSILYLQTPKNQPTEYHNSTPYLQYSILKININS